MWSIDLTGRVRRGCRRLELGAQTVVTFDDVSLRALAMRNADLRMSATVNVVDLMHATRQSAERRLWVTLRPNQRPHPCPSVGPVLLHELPFCTLRPS
jgi:hypothetical protein